MWWNHTHLWRELSKKLSGGSRSRQREISGLKAIQAWFLVRIDCEHRHSAKVRRYMKQVFAKRSEEWPTRLVNPDAHCLDSCSLKIHTLSVAISSRLKPRSYRETNIALNTLNSKTLKFIRVAFSHWQFAVWNSTATCLWDNAPRSLRAHRGVRLWNSSPKRQEKYRQCSLWQQYFYWMSESSLAWQIGRIWFSICPQEYLWIHDSYPVLQTCTILGRRWCRIWTCPRELGSRL